MQIRSDYFFTHNPAFYRRFAARDPTDLDGRFSDHFFTRGDTMVMIPTVLNNIDPPLGVTTWVVTDILQAMQQAYDEDIICEPTYDVLTDILELIWQGTYIDRDYVLPGLLHPSIPVGLREFICELTPSTTWTWEGWISLERYMNEQGVSHGYDPQVEVEPDEFEEHIDENVVINLDYNFGDEMGSLGHQWIHDIDGVIDFDAFTLETADDSSTFSL